MSIDKVLHPLTVATNTLTEHKQSNSFSYFGTQSIFKDISQLFCEIIIKSLSYPELFSLVVKV